MRSIIGESPGSSGFSKELKEKFQGSLSKNSSTLLSWFIFLYLLTNYGVLNLSLIPFNLHFISYGFGLAMALFCFLLAFKAQRVKVFHPLSLFALFSGVTAYFFSGVVHDVSSTSYLKMAVASMMLFSALVCASVFNFNDFLKVVVYSSFVASFLSLAVFFLLPDVAQHRTIHVGDLKGVYQHKNNLGWVASLGITMTLFFLFYRRGCYKWFQYCNMLAMLTVMLSALMLANSSGATLAVLVCFFALFFLLLGRLLANKYIFFTLLAFMLPSVFIVFVLNLEVKNLGSSQDALIFFGYNIGFSGRLTIWDFSIDAIFKSPFLGYGYDNFWGRSAVSEVTQIGLGNIELSDAHNGFVDVALEFGVVLAILFFLFVFYMLIAFLNASYYAWQGAACFLFFVFLVVMNFSESSFTKSMNAFFFLWLCLVFYGLNTVMIFRGKSKQTIV